MVVQIWPVAHFFWGYSIVLPLFLLVLWLVTRNVKVSNLKEFVKKRVPAGVVGGLWAMLPDIDYFLENPIFHNNVPLDIFFFHGTFDTVIPETDLFFATEMLLLFAVVNLFAMALSVESFKRLNVAIFGRKEEEEEKKIEESKELVRKETEAPGMEVEKEDKVEEEAQENLEER